MRKYLLIVLWMMISVAANVRGAVLHSVNYDRKTVAAMVAAFGTETATEMYYTQQVKDILDRYSAAEVATAGIFMSKWLDRRALTDLGIWSSPTENFYYRRIYNMVSAKIMPKIWTVAQMMIHSPQTALYWGSYLYKVCAEVESLCMQFESVVTNGSLSFSDIVFLQIAPEFQPLFALAQTDGVNWQTFFDDMGSIGSSFSKENLRADIENLYQMGVGIASAGSENMMDALLGGNSFNDVINGNAGAIVGAVESSYALYKSLEQDMGGTVLTMLGGPENVAQLFAVSGYNTTAWLTDYMRESIGQYYTQRWYIYRKESGSEVVCNYTPPTDDDAILYGNEWVRFNTTDPDFYPNSTQNEQILANSESYAGWSRSKVKQLNNSNDGYTYTMTRQRYAYKLSKKNKQYAKAYAYSIIVTKSWNLTEEIYEDVFDSYSMDLATFQAQMNARLSEFNDNEEGYTYQIGYDSKNYYNATDAAKLRGTESVIISVTCHDGFTLAQGNTQYKCSDCGGSLNAHSKECAMRTTLSASDSYDDSGLNELESEYNAESARLQAQIDQLTLKNQQLVKQIATATIEEATALRQQYNANKSEIDRLTTEQNTVKQKLADLQAAKEAAAAGEAEQTDDYYRIPAIMQDCKTAYDLSWQDDGHWEGYTYVRTATAAGMSNAAITFKATLSIARKPKYFLGIKIHRAILKISWELTADYSDTQVVDVLQLDPTKREHENTQTVNNRLSQIALEYPSCSVTTEYIKNEAVEQDNTPDVKHLLWSSDRLEIAREVDARLTQIYADLVSLEKMMHYKLSILDVLMGVLPELDAEQGRKRTMADECFERWMENAQQMRVAE